MTERYYDQWKVNDRIEQIRRTVTETDNLLFSIMTHNPQPLHIDADFAAKPEFGRITFRHELINQHGEVVCQCSRAALIKRSPT